MRKQKGFTIIELIVVIAIIAILAAIVLINVTQYINKGKDSAIKGDLSAIQTAANLFYTQNNDSYDGLLGNSSYLNAITAAEADNPSLTPTENGNDSNYCLSVTLNDKSNWCVDSSGFSGSSACGSSTFTCGIPDGSSIACTGNSSCENGNCQNGVCDSYSSGNEITPGGACIQTSDCQGGTAAICVNGSCAETDGNVCGYPGSSDSDCASGYCNNIGSCGPGDAGWCENCITSQDCGSGYSCGSDQDCGNTNAGYGVATCYPSDCISGVWQQNNFGNCGCASDSDCSSGQTCDLSSNTCN